MANVIKYEIGFRRSTLFFIRQKHLVIDLSWINFANLEGHDIPDPGDGVVAATEVEANDDYDEGEDFATLKGPNDAPNDNHVAIEPNADDSNIFPSLCN